MKVSELQVEPKFRDLIPKLSEEEYAQLERNILEDGEIREHIIASLRAISPMAIVREGKEDKYTTGNKRFAKVIVGAYNKGQRQESRLVFKF